MCNFKLSKKLLLITIKHRNLLFAFVVSFSERYWVTDYLCVWTYTFVHTESLYTVTESLSTFMLTWASLMFSTEHLSLLPLVGKLI